MVTAWSPVAASAASKPGAVRIIVVVDFVSFAAVPRAIIFSLKYANPRLQAVTPPG
jgi:hypothetical protein